jgi:hypothetical protein
MADPLVEVAVRVYAEFADRATLAEVLAVAGRCRTDLDTPPPRRYPKWSSDWPGSGSPITSPRVPPATDLDLADTDCLLEGPVRADAVGPVADAARILGVIPSLEQLVEFLDRVHPRHRDAVAAAEPATLALHPALDQLGPLLLGQQRPGPLHRIVVAVVLLQDRLDRLRLDPSLRRVVNAAWQVTLRIRRDNGMNQRMARPPTLTSDDVDIR